MPAFDILFFFFLAYQQSVVAFGYDIIVKTLYYDFAFGRSVNDAVLAIDEIDVLSDGCVIVFILFKMSVKASPCAEVAPSEVGRIYKNLFGLLHYGIVDGDVWTCWEILIYKLLFFFSIEIRFYLVEYGSEVWNEIGDSIYDHLRIPDEDASIPVIAAFVEVRLGGFKIRFLFKCLDFMDVRRLLTVVR